MISKKYQLLNPRSHAELGLRLCRLSLHFSFRRTTLASAAALLLGLLAAAEARATNDSETKLHRWEPDANNRPHELKYDGKLVEKVFYTPGGLVDRKVKYAADGIAV